MTMSSTLFDIQPLVSPRAAEVAPYTCKTCKYCERFRFEKRVIYLYCTQKPLGKLHKRVKSYDKACMKYEHRPTKTNRKYDNATRKESSRGTARV